MGDVIYFVYRLTFANGKVYIGMSKTCPKKGYMRRFEDHVRAAASGKVLPIYSAWRKHGAPVFEVLSEHSNRPDCAVAEIKAIASYGSISDGIGYNIMGGGEGQQAGINQRLWDILNEKVWQNPERIRKCSEKLKGRKPSEATVNGYKEYCKTPERSKSLKKGWESKGRREAASSRTMKQMSNGGRELLSKMFKGRKDPRTSAGKEIHRSKMKALAATDCGKKARRAAYDLWASNPENVLANRQALDKWRSSEKNADNCRKMAILAAEKCSKAIRDLSTGEVFDSQRAMAKAYGVSDAAIAKRRNKGLYEYVRQ